MKVKPTLIALLVIGLLAGDLIHADEEMLSRVDHLSRHELQSVIEFLSHDLLEGRAPGTRGGSLAEEYIKDLYKFMGMKPGMEGSFFQPFTLTGCTTENLEAGSAGRRLTYPGDIVGTFTGDSGPFSVSAPLIFAGFGIRAERWNWDDFKNSDVSGAILVCRVNDPGMFIPDIFEGKTLTYFGRWTYHMEEAARRGALGILLIHTDETAGYGWEVVKNSWYGEELFLEEDIRRPLKIRAWIRESSLKELLDDRGLSLNRLYTLSERRDFTPMALGLTMTVNGRNRVRSLTARNVVAAIPGRVDQHIVLSSHIDHHGHQPEHPGDGIFNGAIDNGSAVAAMVLTARILKEFNHRLHYGVKILACNAEEAGMLGSKYYVRRADRTRILANINFESTPVWEEADSIMGVGARFSEFEAWLKQIAASMGVSYSRFSMSNQGFFYRSDQFSFARYGIPAVWVSAGENDRSGHRLYQRFWENTYHTVEDEFDPSWDLGGLRQTIRAALLLVLRINSERRAPGWSDRITFPWETR